MNKQIEQLLGKALDESVPETWTTLTPEQVMKLSETLTTLVVKECVHFINVRKDEAIDNELNVDEAMSMVNLDLEEHFGIV